MSYGNTQYLPLMQGDGGRFGDTKSFLTTYFVRRPCSFLDAQHFGPINVYIFVVMNFSQKGTRLAVIHFQCKVTRKNYTRYRSQISPMMQKLSYLKLTDPPLTVLFFPKTFTLHILSICLCIEIDSMVYSQRISFRVFCTIRIY